LEDGSTLLLKAAETGNVEMVKLILDSINNYNDDDDDDGEENFLAKFVEMGITAEV